MVGMTRPRSTATASAAATAHDEPLLTDLTSSSMVDLPVGDYHGSTEHLSQDEDCNLPNSSGKSRSVPRLTFMAVNSEGERGKSKCVAIFIVRYLEAVVSFGLGWY